MFDFVDGFFDDDLGDSFSGLATSGRSLVSPSRSSSGGSGIDDSSTASLNASCDESSSSGLELRETEGLATFSFGLPCAPTMQPQSCPNITKLSRPCTSALCSSCLIPHHSFRLFAVNVASLTHAFSSPQAAERPKSYATDPIRAGGACALGASAPRRRACRAAGRRASAFSSVQSACSLPRLLQLRLRVKENQVSVANELEVRTLRGGKPKASVATTDRRRGSCAVTRAQRECGGA